MGQENLAKRQVIVSIVSPVHNLLEIKPTFDFEFSATEEELNALTELRDCRKVNEYLHGKFLTLVDLSQSNDRHRGYAKQFFPYHPVGTSDRVNFCFYVAAKSD